MLASFSCIVNYKHHNAILIDIALLIDTKLKRVYNYTQVLIIIHCVHPWECVSVSVYAGTVCLHVYCVICNESGWG